MATPTQFLPWSSRDAAQSINDADEGLIVQNGVSLRFSFTLLRTYLAATFATDAELQAHIGTGGGSHAVAAPGAAGFAPALSGNDTEFLNGVGNWATPPGASSPLTTVGDLYTRSATADARLGVGNNNEVLMADSSEPVGMKWEPTQNFSPTTTNGDMIYRAGPLDIRLPLGGDGQVLKVANLKPTWVDDSGGDVAKDGVVIVSDVTQIDFRQSGDATVSVTNQGGGVARVTVDATAGAGGGGVQKGPTFALNEVTRVSSIAGDGQIETFGVLGANLVTATNPILANNLARGDGARGLTDSGIDAADVLQSGVNIAAGNLVSGVTGRTVGDSAIPLTDVARESQNNVFTGVTNNFTGTLQVNGAEVYHPGNPPGGSGNTTSPATHADDRLTAFDGVNTQTLKATTLRPGNIVLGPVSALDTRLAAFDGTSGKILRDSGVLTGSVVTGSGPGFTNEFLVKGVANGTLQLEDAGIAIAALGLVSNSQDWIGVNNFTGGLQVNGSEVYHPGNSPLVNPPDTKGDLWTFHTGSPQRLGVGPNGTVLRANSAQTAGLEWALIAGTGDVTGPPAGVLDDELALYNGTTGKIIKGSGGTLIGNVIRNNLTTQVNGDVGYTGAVLTLAPGATETPTPSAGHYRTLSGGSTTVTPPAMTETSWVAWTFDAAVYTIDTSNYQVLGTPPTSGVHTLAFDNFGGGTPKATWFNQA